MGQAETDWDWSYRNSPTQAAHRNSGCFSRPVSGLAGGTVAVPGQSPSHARGTVAHSIAVFLLTVAGAASELPWRTRLTDFPFHPSRFATDT